MDVKIIGKTSTETDIMIWVEIDGLEWGVNEDFDVGTLMCDGTKCDCIGNSAIAHYEAVVEAIREQVSEVGEIDFV